MEVSDLTKPLSIEDIDFRIQSINKGGYATILAYKDARVDIKRLNAVCGALGWKREHTRENYNCIVSIYDKENKHWVSKEDTGTESMAEAQKGLASDSFKRACFNWGIGLELYDYPLIQVKLTGGTDRKQEWFLDNGKPKQGWGLGLKKWVWNSSFTDDGVLIYLAVKDEKGKLRFEYSNGNAQTTGDKVNPEPLDLEKVERGYTYIVTQINDEELEESELIKRLVNAKVNLSSDEFVKVNEKLKLVKYEGRQLNTIFKDYIDLSKQVK